MIFVIDTSGSMHGASIAQAKDALRLALGSLTPRDAFNVIEFNSVTRSVFAEPRRATPDALAKARKYVSNLRADGGTEMFPALQLAFAQKGDPERLPQIIFMTDGAVGNEEQLFALVKEKLSESRLFMIGIGSAPNSFFMRRAAEFGRGTFTYIGKIEEVQSRMTELFAKIERPALTDIAIEWPESAEMWPGKVSDLYFGEPLIVSVALPKLSGVVRVKGKSGAIDWQSEIELADQGGSGIHAVWAREKIEALTSTAGDADRIRGRSPTSLSRITS